MTRTWHPQPLPITVQLSPGGRWMPATDLEDRSPSGPEPFVRDEWSDDPDRTTRRGMC